MNHPGVLVVVLLLIAAGCARYDGDAEDVTFVSYDGVRLSGTLVLPEGEAKNIPGVVLLHGSEPATRSFAYRMHANIFLERGLAVLLYDKRGAGASGGDHDAATFEQFLNDARAAIALLREHPRTDPDRIGVVGASESGWFTPELAEHDGRLAFVINKSGPCLSWRRTVAWEVYNELLADGIEEGSAARQADVYERIWAYYAHPSPEERGALEAVLHEWAGREDSQLPIELRTVDTSAVQDIRYDPAPYLERIATPTLYVYGSDDVNVPTEACRARLRELQAAGRPVSVHVFEGEGHELGGIGPLGYRFADGYADVLARFAVDHVHSHP